MILNPQNSWYATFQEWSASTWSTTGFSIYRLRIREAPQVRKTYLSVGFKNGSTEATYDRLPRFPIKWNETKSRRSSHIGHTCPATAPWTRPRHWLGPPHHPLLIHQEAEANHGSRWRVENDGFCGLCLELLSVLVTAQEFNEMRAWGYGVSSLLKREYKVSSTILCRTYSCRSSTYIS